MSTTFSNWEAGEEELMIRLRASGVGWKDIEEQLPGRTLRSCMSKYARMKEAGRDLSCAQDEIDSVADNLAVVGSRASSHASSRQAIGTEAETQVDCGHESGEVDDEAQQTGATVLDDSLPNEPFGPDNTVHTEATAFVNPQALWKQRPFTPRDDSFLRHWKQSGMSWYEISECLHRSRDECEERYTVLTQSQIRGQLATAD